MELIRGWAICTALSYCMPIILSAFKSLSWPTWRSSLSSCLDLPSSRLHLNHKNYHFGKIVFWKYSWESLSGKRISQFRHKIWITVAASFYQPDSAVYLSCSADRTGRSRIQAARRTECWTYNNFWRCPQQPVYKKQADGQIYFYSWALNLDRFLWTRCFRAVFL